MQRNYSGDKISDRFILGRNKERQIILDKFKIEDNSFKNDIKEEYLVSRCKSQSKSRQINLLATDEEYGQKLYLNLLKTQIFKNSHSSGKCKTDSYKSLKDFQISKNISLKNIRKNVNNTNLTKNNINNINKLNSIKSSDTLINDCKIYQNNTSNNYSLLISKRARNKLLKKRLYEENEKLNNMYGNIFKESFKTFLNFEFDDNKTALNYLKYKSIPKISYKVLDAPNLRDDFYLQLIDWSKQNLLAVGLDNKLYTWNAKLSKVSFIAELSKEGSYYSSLSFNNDGKNLISCSNYGNIFIRNIENEKNEKAFTDFSLGRICNISPMNLNPNIFSFGSRDLAIKTIDLRSKLNPILQYFGHNKEICGMKWSADDKKLASGGDDNKLFIWDIRKEEPEYKFNSHTSAIKALDWSTFKFGYLLSGGGMQDMTLKLWNINNMTLVDSIDTSSQVCNIAFSKISHEFVTTHGYKNNYIYVWDSKNMNIKAKLKGHKKRVVYMALSPDSRKIVTGAGDETIRLWETFGYENQRYNFYNDSPDLNLGKDGDLLEINQTKNKENCFTNFEIR